MDKNIEKSLIRLSRLDQRPVMFNGFFSATGDEISFESNNVSVDLWKV